VTGAKKYEKGVRGAKKVFDFLSITGFLGCGGKKTLVFFIFAAKAARYFQFEHMAVWPIRERCIQTIHPHRHARCWII